MWPWPETCDEKEQIKRNEQERFILATCCCHINLLPPSPSRDYTGVGVLCCGLKPPTGSFKSQIMVRNEAKPDATIVQQSGGGAERSLPAAYAQSPFSYHSERPGHMLPPQLAGLPVTTQIYWRSSLSLQAQKKKNPRNILDDLSDFPQQFKSDRCV